MPFPGMPWKRVPRGSAPRKARGNVELQEEEGSAHAFFRKGPGLSCFEADSQNKIANGLRLLWFDSRVSLIENRGPSTGTLRDASVPH